MNKKLAVAVTLAAGLAIGSLAAVHARLPAPPAKSDAEKAADKEKADAAKAKEGAELAKAQDKAVANYKKNKGITETKSPAKTAASASGKK